MAPLVVSLLNLKDEHVVAFENIRLGGQYHWLITPLKHIRDIESLTHVDLPLCMFPRRQ